MIKKTLKDFVGIEPFEKIPLKRAIIMDCMKVDRYVEDALLKIDCDTRIFLIRRRNDHENAAFKGSRERKKDENKKSF